MEFGFSMVGVVFLLMLFIPNIIWSRKVPQGYTELSQTENPILVLIERIGEVSTTVTAIIFLCPEGFSYPWLLWLIFALLLMFLYELAWIRYFKSYRSLSLMYAPLSFIPLPLATLPVLAFFLLGIWQQSPFTVAAALVLGIGHIGIHFAHRKQLA